MLRILSTFISTENVCPTCLYEAIKELENFADDYIENKKMINPVTFGITFTESDSLAYFDFPQDILPDDIVQKLFDIVQPSDGQIKSISIHNILNTRN